MITQIFEQVLKRDKDDNIISKIAILRNFDTEQLQEDIVKYWGDSKANMFVDKALTDPYTRVIISGINELKYYNIKAHKLLRERVNKLDKITKNNPD